MRDLLVNVSNSNVVLEDLNIILFVGGYVDLDEKFGGEKEEKLKASRTYPLLKDYLARFQLEGNVSSTIVEEFIENFRKVGVSEQPTEETKLATPQKKKTEPKPKKRGRPPKKQTEKQTKEAVEKVVSKPSVGGFSKDKKYVGGVEHKEIDLESDVSIKMENPVIESVVDNVILRSTEQDLIMETPDVSKDVKVEGQEDVLEKIEAENLTEAVTKRIKEKVNRPL